VRFEEKNVLGELVLLKRRRLMVVALGSVDNVKLLSDCRSCFLQSTIYNRTLFCFSLNLEETERILSNRDTVSSPKQINRDSYNCNKRKNNCEI